MGKKTQPVRGEIVLPSSWKKLIDIVFPENLKGVRKGPAPRDGSTRAYYDDTREAPAVRLDDGAFVSVKLCSGQHNYWGSFEISLDGRLIFESVPLDGWPSFLEAETPEGTTYRIKVVWHEEG